MFLGKALRTLMWTGAPFVLVLAWALEAVGIEIPKPVSGTLCLLFGVFAAVCFFVGVWALIV